jgi:hypothetical protein
LVTVPALLAIAAPLTLSAAQAAPGTRDHAAKPSAGASHRSKAMPPKRAVLFGLDDHWETEIVTDDQQDKAKSGIVGTFLTWKQTNVSATTEAHEVVHYAQWARHRGAIPMVALSPPASVTLRSINMGSQNATLAAYAKALRAWNHPFLFRLFPEMNGNWESYSPGVHGNTVVQFRRAFRHVVRLFRHYGANKVKFVWNPDKELTKPRESLRSLWPGKKYVNWTGIDVFDREDKAHGRYPNPVAAIRKTAADIRKITHKPIMIAEAGTVTSSRKPTWIRQLFTGTAPLGVRAVVYFNEEIPDRASGVSVNWRLNSSSSALAATKRTLAGTAVAWPGHNHGTLLHDEYLISKGHW